jgi:MFS family permease
VIDQRQSRSRFLELSGHLPRFYLLAALTDFSLYVLFTAVPHRAMEFSADSFELGLIPAAWAVPYVLVTALGGGLADRYSRSTMARTGAVIYALAAVMLSQARNMDGLYLGVSLVGIGLGCFWPALQAAIADASVKSTLERNLGSFNVAWSLGKALGFVAGGLLYGHLGGHAALGIAAGVGIAVAMGIPVVPRRSETLSKLAEEETTSGPDLRMWRYLGWAANFGAWGLGATVIHLYPEMNKALGRNADGFGVVLMTVYLSQTATFVILRRFRGWTYRVAPFLAMQLMGAGLVILLGFATGLPLALLAAVGIGATLGMGYYSSITYSLRTDTGRGRSTGLHEAALGSANFLFPLVGGALARETGRIHDPYVLAGVIVATGVALQVWFMPRRGRRDGSSVEPEDA